ncbi:2-isopropylmalate synthase [Edaphobacter albus]|uniref:2-isopropylmalate synthase n=1 Tax=Edaphobacter sp. 4G125 TaxID=2763071 RepID=UPI0016485FBE|nr:2-isopropylmalate synthase [Edaphobacter sp. 4G125]QNI36298.1 2-isopropylmalate synthase [Edaphobacter sp. 4G125]
MQNPDQIVFFDTTLRDGEQSPGCTMHHDEKLRMAHQLRDLGVDILEAGFAIASEGDFDAVQAIACEVTGTRIASLARCKREDIDAAGRAIQPARSNRIHIFLASSDLHLEYKLRISREQALDQAAESVKQALTYTDNVEFSTEDGTRTDPDFLVKMITVAVQAGATTINIPDTVGYTTPAEYEAIFRMVRERVPGIENVVLSTHCHDDLGMAVANSLAGIQGGARQVECTINGIGERAGNAALEEIAAALMVRRDKFPYKNNIVMEKLYPTSQMLAECISFGVAPNKAVVGANAFAHESGIHQHGVLANPLTYEIMTPASVGAGSTNLVLGKHSGRRALADRLEKLGHTLTREQLDEVYHRFTELADRKKSIYDQDILGLLKPEKAPAAVTT